MRRRCGDGLADGCDTNQIAAVQPDRQARRRPSHQIGFEPLGQDDDAIDHAAPHQFKALSGGRDDGGGPHRRGVV